MLKRYKAFMKNEGHFAPPGAQALQDFVSVYDQQRQWVRQTQAALVEKQRVLTEEEEAQQAEARAVLEALGRESEDTLRGTQDSGSSVSVDCTPEKKSSLPKCRLCMEPCTICPNPWQRTRRSIRDSPNFRHISFLNSPNVSPISEHRLSDSIPFGIALEPCRHVHCGACLAQAIYHGLNMAFDPAMYGTNLPSYAPEVPRVGNPEFPIPCPTCQSKQAGCLSLINDAVARVVLGESNMDEWNHAQFLASLRVMQCAYDGCKKPFDSQEAPTVGGVSPQRTCIRCPHCDRLLCRSCKSVWHPDFSCISYQASPASSPTQYWNLSPHSCGGTASPQVSPWTSATQIHSP